MNNRKIQEALAIGARLRISLSNLSKTERRIIEWMMAKGNIHAQTGIKDVASQLNVSEPLLVKVAKKVGYSGFRELRSSLISYFSVLPFEREQEISGQESTQGIIDKVFDISIQELKEAQSIVDPNIIDQVATLILEAKHIIIYGVGGSAIVGKDFEHKLLRIGVHSHVYSDYHLMMMVASQVEEQDVVVAISQSGDSTAVCHATQVAKAQGAKIICLTNNHQSELAAISHLSIFSPAKNGHIFGKNAVARIIQLILLDILFITLFLKHPQAAKKKLEQSTDALNSLRKK